MHVTDSNLLPNQSDILIVGAGPTGLALAAALWTLNTPALLVDNQAEGANTSRACVIQPRTLEVLEPLGVVPNLLAEGLKVPIFRVRDRASALVSVDFSELQTAYQYTLMLAQDRTEAILLDRLRSLGGSVVRPAELVAMRPGDDSVEADIDLNGRQVTITAQWLIGCDGAHSKVRELADIPFEGGVYEEEFVLADVRMEWPLNREEVTLFLSPAGMMLVAPLPADMFRVVAAVENAPSSLTTDYFQDIVDERGPGKGNERIGEIIWSSRFRIAHRLSATPYKERVLICGDAAHVHSPAGGQGMNLGIQDAALLAEPLVRALKNKDHGELSGWAESRHKEAAEVVAMTDRLTRLATIESTSGRLVRNAALAFIGHLPGVAKAAAKRLSELNTRS